MRRLEDRMGGVTLLLGIHNHQPQGNFDEVFAQGYADCYARLLEAIERHPAIKLTLHYSGPLVEWLEAHHPDFFDRLAALVAREQVELLGGGFYEPMLAALPERDARAQLALAAEFLEGRVGRRPQGMWLTERVWEPGLASLIASSGHRYTIVDDGHFLAAGMRRPLTGYYLTEKAGLPLCLFPIAMELRYAIPFKPAQEAVDILLRLADRAAASASGDVVVSYGDDGEKFGMWPGTKGWVWDEGWLEKFLCALEAATDRVRTATFGETLDRHAPSGRVYLPTASYDEMGEWALPAEAQQRFGALALAVKAQGKWEEWGPFVRGGIWQGFLAKYAEANFMHKRMCFVSARVARAAAVVGEAGPQLRILETARRELYRGQCNCAYWHGLFGGLYLAKLRSAMHGHLIRADVEAAKLLGLRQPVDLERVDLDADLADEVVLSGRAIGAIVAPARGGTALAIDDRRRAFCLSDVLTRRPEHYHERVRELAAAPQPASDEGAPRSIHDLAALKDRDLADALVYDPHERLGFVDQFLASDLDPSDLWRCRAVELGDFKGARYQLLQASGGAGRLLLARSGRVRARGAPANSLRRGGRPSRPSPDGEPVEVELHKCFQLEEQSLRVEYELAPAHPLPGVQFATELSLALPSGPHPSGELRIGSQRERVTSTGVTPVAELVELHDPWTDTTVRIGSAPAATLVRFPLETASQSESGIERTYQGTTLIFLWRSPLLEAGTPFKPTLSLWVS
jgi:alpha-amylase